MGFLEAPVILPQRSTAIIAVNSAAGPQQYFVLCRAVFNSATMWEQDATAGEEHWPSELSPFDCESLTDRVWVWSADSQRNEGRLRKEGLDFQKITHLRAEGRENFLIINWEKSNHIWTLTFWKVRSRYMTPGARLPLSRTRTTLLHVSPLEIKW